MNITIKQKLRSKKTLIMGILNVTPDSFSDGGLYIDAKKAVVRAQDMFDQGADIIDVGGESTRPGAEPVTTEEELKRILPVIKAIRKKLGNKILISVDTYKALVAEGALVAGVDMVNSVGGMFFDPDLGSVIAKYHCPFIIYHIKGKPQTMQKGQIRYKDVIGDISTFFKNQIREGLEQGIKREQFILDPGIGFGKTVLQNIEIVKKLRELGALGLPLAVGISRKSHLGVILQKKLKLKEIPSPVERLEASLVETAIAVENGASIIRTHDVLETKKFLTVLNLFTN